jgi:hypothetical protein
MFSRVTWCKASKKICSTASRSLNYLLRTPGEQSGFHHPLCAVIGRCLDSCLSSCYSKLDSQATCLGRKKSAKHILVLRWQMNFWFVMQGFLSLVVNREAMKAIQYPTGPWCYHIKAVIYQEELNVPTSARELEFLSTR